MAAIDLEHGGRRWGQERPDLMDNFDSEMQEWEDQLQDIQKKIEELYNEVQTRRGASDIPADNQKNCGPLEYGLGQRGNRLIPAGQHSESHPGDATMSHHQYGNSCNYGTSGYSHPGSHQNGYSYCHSNVAPEIGDLLQDYLGKGQQMGRKNNGARRVHFSDTIKVSPDMAAQQDDSRKRYGSHRLEQEQLPNIFEETENRKNRGSHMKSSLHRDSSPIKENTGTKPPLGQRDAPGFQARSQLPVTATESPSLDRRSLAPGILGDRKGGSPSVLRKFGAMLQENEGKMLTESGVVTNQGPAAEGKCPTPVCQRRALGATAVGGRVPVRVPNQKCQADSNMLTAEVEPGQEWDLVLNSCCQNSKDQRGSYSSCKASQPCPQQAQSRSLVPGSPKIRPRANSGAERDRGFAQIEKARKPALHHVEPKVDYKSPGGSPGPQRIQRGQELPDGCHLRDEGFIELLDMLEIQHEYSSSPRTGYTSYRQEPQQVNPAELSPARPKKNFSRPARPANQRPPSRWASRTPTARITAPSGPMYSTPSPMTRPPSPMVKTPSPALKHRPLVFNSRRTETVIM
ncbi:uncharacterized protein LOC133464749 isoform X3 [Cololabis saira]|uniref:uncharacterized protein LOC133464749 isoform X3 n=1 Tax=Cololabis saira TaxID=129043 RepID=UPI002AD2411D|nr:uncharacterized protein LOC133464749 isoform X3 [Cololabis saira]XP_061602895.1 uncharacterized protein LOC133464749 isoform X3 [Cololabis saira]